MLRNFSSEAQLRKDNVPRKRKLEGKITTARYAKAGLIKKLKLQNAMNAFGTSFIEGMRPYRWMVVPLELSDALSSIRAPSDRPVGTPLADYPFYKQLLELEDYADSLSPRPMVKV